MKKFLNSLSFFIFGLITLRISVIVSNWIDLRRMFPGRTYQGCWDIEHCRIPFWYWWVVGTALALPVLAFVCSGFSLRTGRILHIEAVKKISWLFLATMVFEITVEVIVFFAQTR
jgi:hypothetical protein